MNSKRQSIRPPREPSVFSASPRCLFSLPLMPARSLPSRHGKNPPRSASNRKGKPAANPPAASPATPRLTNRRCIPRKQSNLVARIATEAIPLSPSHPERRQILPNTIPPREKAHVHPRDASFRRRANLPERTYTNWVKEWKESAEIHQVRESRRFARRAGKHVAPLGATPRRRAPSPTSMMTHAGMLLGGAALYNNGGYPAKKYAFRRKLWPRRLAAIDQDVSQADAGKKRVPKA